MPDYEIVEWNETNTDLSISAYVEKAYREKKWAYLTDYLRLYIIYNNGGIYFDTDVEVIKNMDDILNLKYYLACESDGVINTGLGFGAEKGNKVISYLLKEYNNRLIKEADDAFDFIACPEMNTSALEKLIGKENIPGKDIIEFDGGEIYPSEYFCPLNYHTKRLTLTPNTYTIHHYDGSWLSPSTKMKSHVRGFLRRTLFRKKWDQV